MMSGGKELNDLFEEGGKRFKFQSFSERISRIEINVTRRVRRNLTSTNREEPESFFREAIETWKELNCTLDFATFLDDIKEYTNSFVQILYHKETIVRLLIKHLSNQNSLALKPIMLLVVELAKDLREEVYPYFDSLFQSILMLSKSHEVEIVETVFTTIAFLFKYLVVQLVDDMQKTFLSYMTLLTNEGLFERSYIRQFVGQSFAFLVRRLDGKMIPTHIKFMLRYLLENPSEAMAEGLAILFFETVRGMQHQLNSKSIVTLKSLLLELREVTQESDPKEHQISLVMLENLFLRIRGHLRKQSSADIWKLVMDEVEWISKKFHETIPPLKDQSYALKILEILREWTSFRDGELIVNIDQLHTYLISFLTSLRSNLPLVQEGFVDTLMSSLRNLWEMDNETHAEDLLIYASSAIYSGEVDAISMKFSTTCACIEKFHSIFINLFLDFIGENLKKNTLECIKHLASVMPCFPENLTEDQPRLKNLHLCLPCQIESYRMLDLKDHLYCMQFVDVDSKKFLREFPCFFGRLKLMNGDDTVGCLEQALITLNKILNKSGCVETSSFLGDFFLENLDSFRNEPKILLALSDLLPYMRAHTPEKLSAAILFQSVHPILVCHLSSHVGELRLATLRIFASFDQFPFHKNLDEDDAMPTSQCDVFASCLRSEEEPLTLECYRIKILELRKLESWSLAGRLPDVYMDALIRYSLSWFSMKFNLLWETASDVLSQHAKKNPRMFWELFWPEATALLRHDPADSSFDRRNSHEKLNCLKQLLKVLSNAAEITERHSRDFCPLFIECYNRFTSKRTKQPGDPSLEMERSKEPLAIHCNFNDRQIQDLLEALLEILKSFKNLKNLYLSTKVFEILKELLGSSSLKIQELALGGLFAWNILSLNTYKEHLLNFLSEKTFRDNLVNFSIDPHTGVIDASHRKIVMPIILKLLVGKLSQKHQSKANSDSKRGAIFSYVLGCTTEELTLFFDLIRLPFVLPPNVTPESVLESLSRLPSLSTQNQHLQLLDLLVNRMGSIVRPFLNQIILPLICMMANAHQSLNTKTRDSFQANQIELLKNIRHMGITLLANLFLELTNEDLGSYGETICETFFVDMVEKFSCETVQHSNPIFELLIVWSSRAEFAIYFEKYSSLILALLHSLSSKGLHPEVAHSIIQILNNLISQNCLIRHLEQIVDSFKLLLEDATAEIQNDRHLTGEIIHFLTILSEKFDKSNILFRVVDILIPNLKKKGSDVPLKMKCDILALFHRTAHIFVANESSNCIETSLRSRHFRLISFLFSRLRHQKMRLMCCDILGRLVEHLPSMKEMVDLVNDLNSYLPEKVDEWDFAKRSSAFATYSESLVNSLDADAQLPIFYNIIYFLNESEEFSIRQQASFAFRRFIMRLSSESKNPSWNSVCHHIVLPALKRGLRLKKDSVHFEYIQLLHYATKYIDSTVSGLEELHCLLHQEEEADFFHNLTHIQVHRRIRAMKRLGEVLSSKCFHEKLIFDFLLPMVDRIVLYADRNIEPNLYHEAVEVLRRLSQSLSWEAYNRLLIRIQLAIRNETTKEQFLTKALIGVLQEFHFDIKDSGAVCKIIPHEQTASQTIQPNSDSPVEKHLTENEVVQNTSESKIILKVVTKRILPNLYSLVNRESSKSKKDSINLPVVVGIIHLLQRLPDEHLQLHFPRLMAIICRGLRSQDFNVRNSAREILVEIIRRLGFCKFETILKELKDSLRQSFEKHILGYSAYYLLKWIRQNGEKEPLSSASLATIWEIIEQELFGTVSEEKHEQQISGKFKEMRARKGHELVELVCERIDLNGVHFLLKQFHRRWLESPQLSTQFLSMAREMFRKLSHGLAGNPFISLQDLMTVCYSLTTGKLFETLARANNERNGETIATLSEMTLRANDPSAWFPGCGLLIVNDLVKRATFSPSDSTHISLLDPFVDLTMKCMTYPQDMAVTGGLKLFGRLVNFPLPSMLSASSSIYRCLFKLIRRAPSMKSALAQNCIKLVTVLLRHYKALEVPEKQIKAIVLLLIPELEDAERQSASFAFLRAIISRRLIFPEIFEVMDRVTALMVQSQLDGVRNHARQTFFEFLMDFPIGKKRLDDYMVFLVKNLSYEYEAGRLSVLEVVHSASLRFPERLLAKYAVELFLPLVWKLSHDEALVCRDLAKRSLLALLERLPDDSLNSLMLLVQKWLQDDKPALKMASLCVIPLLMGLKKSDIGTDSFLQGLVPLIYAMLEKATNPKLLALGLEALSPLISNSSASELSSLLNLSSRFPSLLLSENMSIQQASLLFISNLLHQCTREIDPLSPRWFISLDCPMKLAEALFKCAQRNSIDSDVSLNAVKSMALVGRLFYSQANLFKVHASLEELGEENPGDIATDINIRAIRRRYGYLTILFQYIVKAVKKDNAYRASVQLCALRWFAAVVALLTPEDLEAYLFYMAFVLCRVLDTTSNMVSNKDSLKELGQELMAMIQEKVGVPIFHRFYQEARTFTDMKRENRKKRGAFEAITDPKARARKKLKKSITKQTLRAS